MSDVVRAPHWWLTLVEPPRAVLEASALLLANRWLQSLPRGDGHTVMVLPGFMANDASTAALRRFLDDRGYQAAPWGFGRNLGPRDRLLEAITIRMRELSESSGKSVSLIGWSLGGIYARELARRAPEVVRQVITLASPFASLVEGGTNAQVRQLFETLNARNRKELESLIATSDEPPPVPSTAIFSRTDGIASWRVCLEKRAARSDNVEIIASHCGMGFNPTVFYVIADRLAQREDAWRPFERSGLRALVFPPAQFRD